MKQVYKSHAPMPFVTAVVCFLFLSFRVGDYRLINSIPFNRVHFTTDRLGNSYVVADNRLLQFDTAGKPKANYFHSSSGRLARVDAGNPLKIVLFYPDFARIQVLNTKLALEATIELRNLDVMQPAVFCQSASENGYWIYDMQDAQLKKINLNLQVKYESGNLDQLLGYVVQPDYMEEGDNFVYINNPSTGILAFDRFGTYVKTIPLTHLSSFQIIGNDLLFVKDNKLFRYGLKTLEQSEVLLPPHDSLLSARIEQRQLYLLTTASLSLYSY